MFDWFAARPPRAEVPPRDRPTIPLTTDERLEFEALCRQVQPGRGYAGRFNAWIGSVGGWGGLPAGLALVLGGGLWCIAWLATSVPLSFLGVLTQAAGLRLVIDSQRLRLQQAGSVVQPSASREQTHAHRRRDQ